MVASIAECTIYKVEFLQYSEIALLNRTLLIKEALEPKGENKSS